MWQTGTIDQRDIFFQYKMMVDDREGLQFSLSYHRNKTKQLRLRRSTERTARGEAKSRLDYPES